VPQSEKLSFKVALSVFADISEDNGTTNRARSVARLLQEHTDMTIVSFPGKDKSCSHRAFVPASGRRQLLQLPFWLMHLIRAALAKRWHLVYCSDDWYGFFIWYVLSKVYRYPIIFEAHGIISEEYRNWGRSACVVALAALVERFVIKHSQFVISLAEGISKFYRRSNPHDAIIPVFVDTNKYRRILKRREELRRHYGVSEHQVIGLIGPFDIKWNEHSLDFLYDKIEAFSPAIRFMVIGRCPRRINDGRVVYTGYVRDYIGHLSCLDIVLIPRKIPTSGPLNKIIEPMSCCLPVLTTPEGTVGLDYATNGLDILVVEEDDLVEMTNSAISNSGLLSILGKNARETVEKRYSMAVAKNKLIEVVYSVMRRARD